MQRLLDPNEAAKISERLHDNALFQACLNVWPERQEEIVSVIARSEDIFCEAAWLMDKLIDANEDIDVVSLVQGLWSTVSLDISRWNSNGVSLPDRYLITSTVFRLVATSFSLHSDSRYCDTLRDALLNVIDEKRPKPANLHEHQQQERQQQELFEAIIPCSAILNEWVNEYIDNTNLWLTEEIDLALNPPLKNERRKTESRKVDKKSNLDYSRYSFRLNVNDKKLENLYVLLSKRDDKGNRFIDGDLMKNNDVDDEIMSNVKAIKDESMRNTAINKYLFNQVFSGQETDVRIVWTSDANKLWYFFNTLYNYMVEIERGGEKVVVRLLEKSGAGPGMFEIVRSRFMNGKKRKVLDERTGKMIETSEPIEYEENAFNKYSKANSPHDTSILDAIINKIAPPRVMNDKEAIDEETDPWKYGIKIPKEPIGLEGDFHDTSHKGKYE